MTRFIDGMASARPPAQRLPLRLLLDARVQLVRLRVGPAHLPRPEGMLARLHDKDLRVCVWINPYIGAARPRCSPRRRRRASSSRRPDGVVWQWDLWQAGMALVDFTNPDADGVVPGEAPRACSTRASTASRPTSASASRSRSCCADGSDPQRMHNSTRSCTTRRSSRCSSETRGEGEAVVFARSATAGGQRMPVHWGGDSTSTFESMAETLRGGLSLADQRLRLLEPRHRRLRGHAGRRCLQALDRVRPALEPQPPARLAARTACRGCSTTRRSDGRPAASRTLKLRADALPLRRGAARPRRRAPVMRPMLLEFPDDPAVALPRPAVHARVRPAGRAGALGGRARWSSTCPGVRGRTS